MTARSTYYTTYTIPAYYKYVPAYYKYTAPTGYAYNLKTGDTIRGSYFYNSSWEDSKFYINTIFGTIYMYGNAAPTWPSGYAYLTVNGYKYATTLNSHGFTGRLYTNTWTELHFNPSYGYYYWRHSVTAVCNSWGSEAHAYHVPKYITDWYASAYESIPAYYKYTAAVYQYTAPRYYQQVQYRYQII